ncbi:MAG TPA: protein kinase [Pyrinomonadaceae bacterium]|jgi:serine/threonine protein kinase
MKSSAAHIAEANEGLLNLQGLRLDARFEVERRLTCGSYSEIYLARNLSPRRDEPETLIVKALNLWLQGELDADLERTLIENIALEAQTMKNFRHENIVRLFSYGRALDQDGRQFYYLVLEYMHGGSLAQLCRARPLTFEQTLDYTAQICAALSYVHARDIIHRDVKPNNIVLSADYRQVKMLDFGVARLLGNDNGLITKVGTDLYAAPEHYSLAHVSGIKLTPTADVYALAKSVYFMLCGKPPSDFRQRQITSLPILVEAQSWAVDVLRILFKATSESPPDRYQSAQDFYQALQATTERTTHSIHSRREATVNQKRPNLRIVINVIPKQTRTCSVMVKARWKLLAGGARSLTSCIKKRSGIISSQAYLIPLNCKVGLINLWQYVAQYLKTLPLKLLLRIAAVIILCLTLLIVTPHLVKWWRLQSSLLSAKQNGTKAPTEEIAIASTDINIRSGPSRKAPKIGLVKRNSKVRILAFSSDQRWCEIEVLQHGRDKEEASAADRGWIYFKALR